MFQSEPVLNREVFAYFLLDFIEDFYWEPKSSGKVAPIFIRFFIPDSCCELFKEIPFVTMKLYTINSSPRQDSGSDTKAFS